MKTMAFRELIERSIVDCYGPENASTFDNVPYLDDEGPTGEKAKICIGIFVSDVVHMASVSAQAMLILLESMDKTDPASVERVTQDMEDFVILMQLFRVAPYMQWTCIYFPGLVDGDGDTDEIVDNDVTGVPTE
jgi:hypothetical protein